MFFKLNIIVFLTLPLILGWKIIGWIFCKMFTKYLKQIDTAADSIHFYLFICQGLYRQVRHKQPTHQDVCWVFVSSHISPPTLLPLPQSARHCLSVNLSSHQRHRNQLAYIQTYSNKNWTCFLSLQDVVNDQFDTGMNSSQRNFLDCRRAAVWWWNNEWGRCHWSIDPLNHSKRFTRSTLDPLMDYKTWSQFPVSINQSDQWFSACLFVCDTFRETTCYSRVTTNMFMCCENWFSALRLFNSKKFRGLKL